MAEHPAINALDVDHLVGWILAAFLFYTLVFIAKDVRNYLRGRSAPCTTRAALWNLFGVEAPRSVWFDTPAFFTCFVLFLIVLATQS